MGAKSFKKSKFSYKKKANYWQDKCTDHCSLSNVPVYLSDSVRFLDGHSLTKYGDEIDSQRQNLYDAQGVIYRRYSETLDSVKKCQKYIDYILGLKWFQRRWPVSSVRVIGSDQLKRPANARRFYQGGGSWDWRYNHDTRIKVRRSGVKKVTLLHELAHMLVPHPHAGHGRLYCRTFLELVRWRFGDDAYKTMKQSFRDHNVNYSPKRTAPWE